MSEILMYTNLAIAGLTILLFFTKKVEQSNFRLLVIGVNLSIVIVSIVLFILKDSATYGTFVKTLSISIYMILFVTYDLATNRLRNILIWSFLVCTTVLISGLLLE